MNKPKVLIVHHTAVSRTKNGRQFKAVNNYHKGKRFPKSSLGYFCGYHYFIEPNGDVITAKLDSDIGAHTYQQGMNYKSIGIGLAGNFDVEAPTNKQKEALSKLLRGLSLKYDITTENILPHRKFAPKSCFGSKLKDDWASKLVGEKTNLEDLEKRIDGKLVFNNETGDIAWFYRGKLQIAKGDRFIKMIASFLVNAHVSNKEWKDLSKENF